MDTPPTVELAAFIANLKYDAIPEAVRVRVKDILLDAIASALARWPAEPGMGWPSWAFENHDAPRALSRWAEPADRARFARMKMLLLALPVK